VMRPAQSLMISSARSMLCARPELQPWRRARATSVGQQRDTIGQGGQHC
jgi:hypothetical protein